MKRLSLVLIAAGIVLLAGCASSGGSYATHATGYKTDAAYVSKVEAIARRRGVEVKWVNPPREADRRISQR